MHDKNFKTQSLFGKKSLHFLKVVAFVYEKLGCMLTNLGHNLKIKIRGAHLRHITMRILSHEHWKSVQGLRLDSVRNEEGVSNPIYFERL